MMQRILTSAFSMALVLLFMLTAAVSAHTGRIDGTVDCAGDYHIEVTLDANVAADSTWVVTVDGNEIGSGAGPGPQSLNFSDAWTGGDAVLSITFGTETNTYTATLDAPTDCATPTPTNSLVPPETSPPQRTLPPTDTEVTYTAAGPMGPQPLFTSQTNTGLYFMAGILFTVGVLMVGYGTLARLRSK